MYDEAKNRDEYLLSKANTVIQYYNSTKTYQSMECSPTTVTQKGAS
jgi:hypothetical protein